MRIGSGEEEVRLAAAFFAGTVSAGSGLAAASPPAPVLALNNPRASSPSAGAWAPRRSLGFTARADTRPESESALTRRPLGGGLAAPVSALLVGLLRAVGVRGAMVLS